MKKDGTRRLNTQGNEFVADLDEWIEHQTSQGNQQIALATVYKNFTGIGGPNNKNYGLSRRMIDLYLLCLVREAKIRITLSGKGPVETLDYTNIADQTFNAALLNSMARLQRLKAPEGWPVLAPYAALLLDDDSLKSLQKDGDIAAAVEGLRKWREQKKPELAALAERLDALVADVQQANPVAECLASWRAFLDATVDDADSIAHLLHAFDAAFSYTCYAQQECKCAELDDLATRKIAWERAEAFCRHDQRIRAAYRYAQLQVRREGPVGELRDKLRSLGKKFDHLTDLMESEAKLQSQLLDLLDGIQAVYRTRYLQAFDEVTGGCEHARAQIDGLGGTRPFQAVAALAQIDALGSIDLSQLNDAVSQCKERLFRSSLDRNGVERGLKERPLPEGCLLHVDEAAAHVAQADQALTAATGLVWSALVNMASLLRQPALRCLLEQGKQEPFIGQVLAAPSDDALAHLLAECVPPQPAHVKLLARYLKKIVVKVVRLQDFQPTKSKVERADIETVVGEFRQFLETAVGGDGKSQTTIVEIK